MRQIRAFIYEMELEKPYN